jgi:hypothetical protein
MEICFLCLATPFSVTRERHQTVVHIVSYVGDQTHRACDLVVPSLYKVAYTKYDVELGSVVSQAICNKPEGRRFETRWGECIFSIYLIFLAALGLGVYSASNRNEYQESSRG